MEDKYNPEKAKKIIESCKKRKAFKPDPYFPNDEEETYYLIFDESAFEYGICSHKECLGMTLPSQSRQVRRAKQP